MIVTSTGARLSAWAAKRPPKPVPTITTRGRPVVDALPGCTGDVVMMNPVSHSGGPRPRRAGSDPGHILPAQRGREPIGTCIQDNDGVEAGMPRVVLVPGLGLDARSSARLRALLTADVVLLPGMGRGRAGAGGGRIGRAVVRAARRRTGGAGRALAELPGGRRCRAGRAGDRR